MGEGTGHNLFFCHNCCKTHLTSTVSEVLPFVDERMLIVVIQQKMETALARINATSPQNCFFTFYIIFFTFYRIKLKMEKTKQNITNKLPHGHEPTKIQHLSPMPTTSSNHIENCLRNHNNYNKRLHNSFHTAICIFR